MSAHEKNSISCLITKQRRLEKWRPYLEHMIRHLIFRIDEDDSIRGGGKDLQGIGLQGSYVWCFAVLSWGIPTGPLLGLAYCALKLNKIIKFSNYQIGNWMIMNRMCTFRVSRMKQLCSCASYERLYIPHCGIFFKGIMFKTFFSQNLDPGHSLSFECFAF